MNTRMHKFFLFLGIFGLIAMAIVAISPLIALGSNQIVFTVVPALEAVRISVFGS